MENVNLPHLAGSPPWSGYEACYPVRRLTWLHKRQGLELRSVFRRKIDRPSQLRPSIGLWPSMLTLTCICSRPLSSPPGQLSRILCIRAISAVSTPFYRSTCYAVTGTKNWTFASSFSTFHVSSFPVLSRPVRSCPSGCPDE